MRAYQALYNPNFVGREDELRWLEDHVSFRSLQTPIFVVGVGGVGKTALVKQWLASRRNRGIPSWGTLTPEWLDLYSPASAKKALEDFVKEQNDETSPANVGRQESVLVLDGAETLSDPELDHAIRRLFNRKRIRSVVLTTRRRPRIERAEVLQMYGLESTETERMLRLLGGKSLSQDDITAAVNATHGFPLAVALLAAVAGDGRTTIADYLARPLYEVADGIVIPQTEILTTVAPRIVIATESLVEELKRRPESVYDLPPRKFEELLAELLSNRGWRVEVTPATRDGGKDILAYLNTDFGELLCLVEAKRYRQDRKVGIDLVRNLYGTLCDYQANSAMLVTTSSFTSDCREFQRKHQYQLTLKDYADLVPWIQQYKAR
jgi:restriction system protein